MTYGIPYAILFTEQTTSHQKGGKSSGKEQTAKESQKVAPAIRLGRNRRSNSRIHHLPADEAVRMNPQGRGESPGPTKKYSTFATARQYGYCNYYCRDCRSNRRHPRGSRLEETPQGARRMSEGKKIRPQDKWNAAHGLVTVSYKLTKSIADEFSEACKAAGVSKKSQLEKMMREFIKQNKKKR